jgi:Salmonella virulence plasmid 65kDa B protein/Insecticide toxin TcdB middle/N-terminal region/FG-GAP-like repeat
MSLPGQFAVNQTGAATYTIPIAVPPGTAGMIPSLSLEYNSQSTNGLLGVGWTLGGLPSIGRCPQTIAHDGVSGGINFDANDRFCMEGERLVVVNGTYGADGAIYRTEVDTFSKIVSHGAAGNGPAWFEVHTKSGQIMEFGHTADSQIPAQGKTTARVWALNRMSDTKANYFTVSYTNDTAHGQYFPNRIDYTGNTAASVSPGNSVQFAYVARTDITPAYQAGSFSETTVRLTDIKTYAGTALVADYQLIYDQSPTTQRSRLTSITACDPTGVCQPPTVFAWQNGGNSFNQSAAVNTGFGDNVPVHDQRYFVMDVNGDGRQDFVARDSSGNLGVWLANGATFGFSGSVGTGFGDNVPVHDQRYFVMDVNGDGRQDFVARDSSGNLGVWLANGVSFSFSGSVGTGFGDNVPVADTRYFIMDVNGDGRQDFVARDGNGNLSVWLANGMTFSYAGSVATGFGDNVPVHDTRYFIMDVNGDGKQDFVARDSNGNLGVWLANGTTFSFSGSVATGFGDNVPVADQRYFIVDVNGDGKQDFVARDGNGNLSVWLANGVTFSYAGSVSTGFGDNVPVHDTRYFIMDVNGDGKRDFVARDGNGNLSVFLSNGTTFTFAGSAATGFGDNVPVHDTRYFIMDVNWDGRQDFVARDSSGNFSFFLSNGITFAWAGSVATAYGDNIPVADQRYFLTDYNASGCPEELVVRGGDGALGIFTTVGPTDLLSSVTNGLGATTAVGYQPLTNTSVYTKDSGAVFPVVDIQGQLYVASRVASSNGVGGTYSSTYTYAGARMDLSGRGFLGFRQMAVNDLQTGITDVTTYRQDFPYLGLVASTSRLFGAQVLGQSTNTYQFSNASGSTTIGPASAPYQVSLSQNVSSGADLDGSALPTVTTANQYDAFGNATQVVVSTDGFSKTTTNTFTNDATNWYLGRLVGASVTSVAP